MKARSMAVSVLAGLLTMIALGCDTGPRRVDVAQPSLSIRPNHGTILAGESTIIVAHSANLIGRPNNVRWSTTMGQIEPSRDTSTARFTADRPGVAIISADLDTDGRMLHSETKVTVNSMR